jgi:hypothetical protein
MALPKINLSVDELILDPNNPRFSKNEQDIIQDEDRYEDEDVQQDTLRKMTSDNEFDISSLEKSIKENGYISIVQPILVRKIKDKYLAIEGNRRTSALKELKRKHQTGKATDLLRDDVLTSLDEIEVVDCTNAKKEEIDMLLGMIHVGGTKDWELLPSSFYLYKLYIEIIMNENGVTFEEADEAFEYSPNNAKIVAAKASVKLSQVRDNLKIYRAYNQLYNELNDLGIYDDELYNHRKASLIGDSIKNSTLKKYFGFDDLRYKFSEEGKEKWINLMIQGDDGEGNTIPKVITSPSTGDSTLRDFAKIIADGNESDRDRVYIDREKTSVVAADVMSRKNRRTLNLALKTVKGELGKIEFEDVVGIAEDDKDLLNEIEGLFLSIKGSLMANE